MTELVLNPNLVVRPLFAKGSTIAYSLVALVKGRGRLHNTVEIAKSDEDIISVLKGLFDADADVDVPENAYAVLAQLGVLVHEEQIARRVEFSCRVCGDGEPPITSLIVNPGIFIMAFPDFVRQENALLRILEPCEEIVLVTDPVTEARYPYWFDERERALLKKFVPGAPPPSELECADVCRFARAGILIDRSAVAAARQRLRAAATQFTAQGYVELPQLLPPSQLAALRAYFQSLLDEGYIADHDNQVDRRFALQNESVMRYYQRELCGVFAHVVSQSIKPSYGYYSSYRHGAKLKKHVDRLQCKFTASLLIDYDAGQLGEQGWPLYLELPATRQEVALRLRPGDCAVFLGCELPHYRTTFRGDRSTSLLLHYVDKAFAKDLR